MARLNGLLETCIYVDDLEAAKRFYLDLFGFDVLRSDERFCALDAGRGTVLILFRRGATTSAVQLPGGLVPSHDGSGPAHFAFAAPLDELPRWKEELRRRNIPLESEATWPMGGRSLYFRDPDGHLVELASPGIWRASAPPL